MDFTQYEKKILLGVPKVIGVSETKSFGYLDTQGENQEVGGGRGG